MFWLLWLSLGWLLPLARGNSDNRTDRWPRGTGCNPSRRTDCKVKNFDDQSLLSIGFGSIQHKAGCCLVCWCWLTSTCALLLLAFSQVPTEVSRPRLRSVQP
ncbi:hypothetical protein QBC45DRAFT_417105 [Copromyces sp. CBS 386.78]|nr:hypothetical protein QBC45DRAFT_417105 [Copromyces sp. CBS 386.78]